jgi:hypothetical protein
MPIPVLPLSSAGIWLTVVFSLPRKTKRKLFDACASMSALYQFLEDVVVVNVYK